MALDIQPAALASVIAKGQSILGIELGSSRIKASLVTQDGTPVANASHGWENQLINGIWTYSLDAVWSGLQHCIASLGPDPESWTR